jgi:hypothetical protein
LNLNDLREISWPCGNFEVILGIFTLEIGNLNVFFPLGTVPFSGSCYIKKKNTELCNVPE